MKDEYIENYKNLAERICLQALEDINYAYDEVRKNPRNISMWREIEEIRELFNSDYFATICPFEDVDIFRNI